MFYNVITYNERFEYEVIKYRYRLKLTEKCILVFTPQIETFYNMNFLCCCCFCLFSR